MKILYGVQATGNGHISRSRELLRELKALGHDVQVLFSGREEAQLWDVEKFRPYKVYEGLTFQTSKGKIDILKTALNLNLVQFFKDIRNFDGSPYDLVITDYEPISARVAKKFNKLCIGVGHQYAFFYKVPICGGNLLTTYVLKKFAPAQIPIGLHWFPFEKGVLPPIIPELDDNHKVYKGKVLVYLPFEDRNTVLNCLRPFDENQFFIYGFSKEKEEQGNLSLRPFSRDGFLKDLHECEGVICNAGFELPSEALHLGKKVLVRPITGQMEQKSNSFVIRDKGLGQVMERLDSSYVKDWFSWESPGKMGYGNVAKLVAKWIEAGHYDDLGDLYSSAWEQCNPERVKFTY